MAKRKTHPKRGLDTVGQAKLGLPLPICAARLIHEDLSLMPPDEFCASLEIGFTAGLADVSVEAGRLQRRLTGTGRDSTTDLRRNAT